MALPNKPTAITIPPDATIIVVTPGAGGYGPPAERDAKLVEQDFVTGKFDAGYMDRHYPVQRRRASS